MSAPIIETQPWHNAAWADYILQWERAQFDHAVADRFGYHALQLGLPAVDALGANRMPHRWRADVRDAHGINLVCDPTALPFPAQSLDLVALPHTLEQSSDPQLCLREVERVLVPEGRALICGFHPWSLWGLRQRRSLWFARRGWGQPFLPQAGDFIGYWRLRDWLRLLGFEVETVTFGAYRPALRSPAWLQRMSWMDALSSRGWPLPGALVFVVAVKRVAGMRLLSPPWKRFGRARAATVSVAGRAGSTGFPGSLRSKERQP